MSRLLEQYQINIWVCGKYPIQGTRSRFLLKVRDRFVPVVLHLSWTLSLGFEKKPYIQMLIWYFSNNLDIYFYVGKLPKQHFSVWLFSNPGDKIVFLFKFNEARISEWNLSVPTSHPSSESCGFIRYRGNLSGNLVSTLWEWKSPQEWRVSSTWESIYSWTRIIYHLELLNLEPEAWFC